MQGRTPRLLAPLGAVAVATLLAGAGAEATAQRRPAAAAPAAYDTTFFAGLRWQNVGPERGGRSIAVAGSNSRPSEFYFGAVGGGLWKTTDAGNSWRPVTDGFLGSSSVGAVAVCETNPDVVYIGTGESQLRGNVMPGDGVYKSTDAGKTWKHIGLREAHNISRIRVDPRNCDRAFVAAFGHYGDPNPERGVFRTTDGGQSWSKVLFRDEKTAAVEVVIDPSNPQVLYAALWEAYRKPWEMSSGGPGSGLFKSTDGGDTWTELSRRPGLPQNQLLGKIGVTVSPVDPNRVYAIVEADSGGVFRSDDGGNSWTRTNDERKLRQRAFYYSRIYADTKEKDRVYVLNVGFFRSDDGGKTFDKTIRVPHSDNHDLWIAANDNQRMVQANDGGGTVSLNGGESWTEQDFPTAQLYYVSTTHHQPYHACGGQQDNSTVCVAPKGWEHMTANNPGHGYYYAVGGGESGHIANDPRDPNVFYAGSYGGLLTRFDYRNGQERVINVWPENPMGESSRDIRERFQWSFPIIFSRTDPRVLYTTSQHVFRSTNGGHSWERISPDLTRHDPSTLGPSGGPITKDQTGVETYATVFSLAPSARDGNLIWAGSDDGLVHVTRDGGQSWQNVTPADLPPFTKITIVEASPHEPGRAYFAGHRFLLGDFTPYLYRTEDFGKTWTRITEGLGANEIARSIREDVVRPGLLFAGTERGVYVSFDNGGRWQSLQRNLPVTQVPDMQVEDHDLVIATHGRSMWVLPNIDVLRQMTPEVARRPSHLFAPAPAVRGVDRGVAIDYYLSRPAGKVTLEVLDPQGRVVRTFTGTPADTVRRSGGAGGGEDDSERPRQPENPSIKPGLNRFTWDMRYPGFTDFPGMILWAARNVGPQAVPGQYQVRLTVDGRAQTQPFEIRLDPRVRDVTPAELQKRFDLSMQIRDKVSQANEAVLLIRGIRQQADTLLARTQNPQVTQAVQAMMRELGAVEGEIYQVRNRSNQDPLNYPIKLNNKIAALLGVVESADAPPTEQSYQVFAELSRRLEAQLARMNQVLDQQLPALNQQLRAQRLPEITRTPLKPQPAGAAAAPRGEAAEEEEEKRW